MNVSFQLCVFVFCNRRRMRLLWPRVEIIELVSVLMLEQCTDVGTINCDCRRTLNLLNSFLNLFPGSTDA